MPEDFEMWSHYLSFRFFTMFKFRRSSCTPVAFWFCCHLLDHGRYRKCLEASYSSSSQGLGSFFRVLLSMASSHRHKGGWIRRASALATLEESEMFLSRHMIFSLERAAVVWAIMERIFGFDPALEMIAPRYLKFSTASSLWPFIFISLWKPFGLFDITYISSGPRRQFVCLSSFSSWLDLFSVCKMW